MGEEEDPQKLKKVAASAYDYENDPRWADFWSNILIPPHMASRIDVIDHFKHKFYQRFIDHDLIIDPMPSSGSHQTNIRAAAPPPSSSPQSSQPRRQQSRGATTGTNAASLHWNRKTIEFAINAWVLVVTVVAWFPFVSTNVTLRACRLSYIGTTCSTLYNLYSLYGIPRARNLPTIQAWFQTIITAKDFISTIYCFMFLTSSHHLKFALIPIFCRSIAQDARFLRLNFRGSSFYRRYLDEPCLWVDSNSSSFGILASHAEITLGFLLIVSLFSWHRSIIQTFMYWQLLKLMYHAPATSVYHKAVWGKVGRTIDPLANRYAPSLNPALAALKRWWIR